MNKATMMAVSAVAAISCAVSAVPAQAKDHGKSSHYQHDNGNHNGARKHWRTWGGSNGYNGYHGKWRAGQKFTDWRNTRYYVTNYRAYDLPPPRAGYRYYRDASGDIVLASIATGVIAAILGN